jgi:polysaccharide chain length determinant protein (PEP-CTERM system associated)
LKGLVVDEDNMSQQLGLMNQLLVSRPNLEQVARIVGFDRQAQTPQQLETMLYRLKQNISVVGRKTNPENLNPRASYLDLYTISYSSSNPELASQVVQALITTFKDNIIGKTRQDAEMTKQFLEQQIKEYEKKLTVAESRLREFKRQNIDVLPDKEQDYFTRLQSTRLVTEDIELQIREAESQRNQLQQQLAGMSAGQRAVSSQGTPVLTPAESRLLILRARLDELLLNYTEEHPDVATTRRIIAELEKQREAELKELLSGTTSSAGVANTEYQQAKLQLREFERQLAALRTRKEEYHHRVQALQQQRETLPIVEAELQRLNRDYEINKERYNALVERRESMKMSEDIQQTDEEVKFKIVEIPHVTMWRTWRSQIILITEVLVAGLGGGLILAFVLSRIRSAVYSRRTLGELTGFPVFGTISQIWTSSMRRRQRLELASFALVSLMMIVAYGVVLFLQFSNIGLDAILQALRGGG